MMIRSKINALVDEDVIRGVLQWHTLGNFLFSPSQGQSAKIPDGDIVADLREAERKVTILPSIELKYHDPHNRSGSADLLGGGCVSQETLERLLTSAFGETDGRRAYPSAGALYPVQVFILIPDRESEDELLASGVYHFLPKTNSIEKVAECAGDLFDAFKSEVLPHSFSFAFVFMINVAVATVKYRYRGYRFALMEAGSMYGAAERTAYDLGLGTRVWGGFSDHLISKLCNANPVALIPAVTQLFGGKKAK